MQRALTQLQEHAVHLVQNEPEKRYLPLMRNKAAELQIDLDVKDSDLESYLEAAEQSLNPVRVYRAGDRLQATEPSFLLDGLIQLGETNLIVGQPKVGKSSFMIGFAAALRDRRETFLGRDIALPNERMPVLLFGTDQSEGNWLHFLKREGIANEDQSLNANAIDFFCDVAGSDIYNFTKDGLRNMRDEIEKYQFPLVIIDSLSSMMEATGIEENTSRFAQPIRNAIRELRKTGATLVILHHTVKRPTTWDWIAECRGSSSISSVMSWGVLMRYVTPEDEGLARTDKRVGFAGKGRGSADSGGVMGVYLDEGGWCFLDGLERAQAVTRLGFKIGHLGGVRAQIFDYLTQRAEVDADVCVEEVATELNKQMSHVRRELRLLKNEGLAAVVRQEETGGRPRLYWSLTDAAHEWALGDSLGDLNGLNDLKAFQTNKIIKINSQDGTAKQPSQPFGPPSRPTSVDPLIPPHTPVEIERNGSWEAGWLSRHSHNPHAITVEKLGNPNITLSNLRLGIDVRKADVVYSSPSTTTNDLPF